MLTENELAMLFEESEKEADKQNTYRLNFGVYYTPKL